jgi:hypothetical protein
MKLVQHMWNALYFLFNLVKFTDEDDEDPQVSEKKADQGMTNHRFLQYF